MVRKIINCPNIPQAKDNVTELNLKVEFISPLFGGSSEKGKNDIREVSIRGQLRFWWRATIGAGYNSVKEMREKEGEIFGNTDKASNVILKIINRQKSTERDFTDFNPANSYVLFPFRGQQNQPNINGIKNIKFDLQVKILKEEIIEDVKKTLTAWINFGGLGARTRRGLGSLYCKDYAFNNINELKSFVQQNNTKFPSINRIFYKNIQGNFDLLNKFYDTVSYLKIFRQGKKIGRNPGSERPGRSLWPEADTLGSVFSRIPAHEDRITGNKNAFPRAEFGLPIIIDFRKHGEPPKTQVLPENAEQTRFASPLILKNIKLSNGQIYNLAIKLNGILPKKVRLDTKRNNTYDVYWDDSNKKTKNGSAIEGFIEFIKKNGFAEINGGAR